MSSEKEVPDLPTITDPTSKDSNETHDAEKAPSGLSTTNEDSDKEEIPNGEKSADNEKFENKEVSGKEEGDASHDPNGVDDDHAVEEKQNGTLNGALEHSTGTNETEASNEAESHKETKDLPKLDINEAESHKEPKDLPKLDINEADKSATKTEDNLPIQEGTSPTSTLGTPQRHTRLESVVSYSHDKVENWNIFKQTFEKLLSHKSNKKNEQVKTSLQRALDSLNDLLTRKHHVIFEALKVTCENSTSSETRSTAIDLFAKLFDYAQFDNEDEKAELTDSSVDVIAACFEGEGTDADLELQVVRALMHSILLMPCHGAALLKAVRQIYNVFIFSLSARNQAIAQGILTQVIGAVFQRISESNMFKGRKSIRGSRLTSKEELETPSDNVSQERLTLEKMNDETYDEERSENYVANTVEDIAVKDAFLIFRAMCKLSVKPLESDSLDMRSHSVRSKLLSLHIIHIILKGHIEIFLSHDVVMSVANSGEHTRLISAVRQYICLTLSRNAASPIAPVFELSLEIFWIIISNLRSEFKREIPVFWDEIYFPVAEMKTSTPHQKRYLLSIIERLCNDSRCIIEFYLNYDCDSSMPNICEKIIDYLTRLSLVRVEVTAQQKLAYQENKRNGISVYDVNKIANLTSSTMSSKPPEPEIYNQFPVDFALKMTSIGCSVAFLRSLYSWAHKGMNNNTLGIIGKGSGSNVNLLVRNRSDTTGSNSSATISRNDSFATDDVDDPEQFENLKQRKKTFLEGIRQFNTKGKRGIAFFLNNNFITNDDPNTIATFLLNTDGLDKAMIGEYLGEADEKNVAIMHAFVDQMEFANTEFVDAMRRFLQAFRLPGEAQKIDRFMLKFAERYVLGNPTIFSNADAAYILAYSVILLNTDLHSPQIKRRMTVDNFVINNAGIDDGNDLPREFLQKVYDEIQSNEIKLQSEQHAALLAGDLSVTVPAQSSGFFGSRDLNREAYIHASKEMSSKAEKMMRSLGKIKGDDGNGVFYAASNIHHVKSIFDTLWMSILAGLTPPFKEYDEEEICKTCLEGIKLSIRISCMFDLNYARTSFIGALVQFENLNNYEEMKPKNVDAIYIMLNIAVTEGNNLGSAWGQVLTSISQLERLILIAQGVDQDSIPDVSVAKLVSRGSTESSRPSASFFGLFTTQSSASQTALNRFHNQHLSQAVAQLLTKTELEVAIDRVFTNSANLSGENILSFVKALAEVAYEEIESLGQRVNPRTFSLQKIVDICYYNMNRIRLEWSQLWAVMGAIFNTVGCHTNLAISFLALDSLRQLSMRFLEIEELTHFKFQKEFLKPFEYIILHNDSLEVKDMVLECINNMVLARAPNIRSGWKTIFGVLTAAARGNKESMVMKSYRMAGWINKEYIGEVRAQESFADLVVCFTELAKNERFQKVSLLSLDVLQKLITDVAKISFVDKDNKLVSAGGSEKNDALVKLWFPVLFGFHDIIMTGEELEVRSRALSFLFSTLMEYGNHFEPDFWDMTCRQLLFPIFSILNTHWNLSMDDTNDKLSVWLSTTLIQALKSMITLFTHYFDALGNVLDLFLELIISCICQENDTIASIGRECLATLLVDNANKFSDKQWEQVVLSMSSLFDLTTAKELFTSDPLLNQKLDSDENGDVTSPEEPKLPLALNHAVQESEVRMRKTKEKSLIVLKSVLQLLLIQTVSELFENDAFYEAVPHRHLMLLADLLHKSYKFARKFNDDYDLRVRLWNAKVIERLPNLLKQELSSLAVLINIMFRMYCDDDKTNAAAKEAIMDTIIPLCNTITRRYGDFDEANQQRNIATWKPVIVEIFQGYIELDDADFMKYAPEMYRLTLLLFSKSMSADLRQAVKIFLQRTGEEFIKDKI